jgi:hypothetical protein
MVEVFPKGFPPVFKVNLLSAACRSSSSLWKSASSFSYPGSSLMVSGGTEVAGREAVIGGF